MSATWVVVATTAGLPLSERQAAAIKAAMMSRIGTILD
jgi:hypothetical protein